MWEHYKSLTLQLYAIYYYAIKQRALSLRKHARMHAQMGIQHGGECTQLGQHCAGNTARRGMYATGAALCWEYSTEGQLQKCNLLNAAAGYNV